MTKSIAPMLTRREVAALIRANEDAVSRLVHSGRLHATRVGKRLLFAESDVRALLMGDRLRVVEHADPFPLAWPEGWPRTGRRPRGHP